VLVPRHADLIAGYAGAANRRAPALGPPTITTRQLVGNSEKMEVLAGPHTGALFRREKQRQLASAERRIH